MRPYLQNNIGLYQSNFMPQHYTTDNALVAQEVIHYMHKKKGKNGIS